MEQARFPLVFLSNSPDHCFHLHVLHAQFHVLHVHCGLWRLDQRPHQQMEKFSWVGQPPLKSYWNQLDCATFPASGLARLDAKVTWISYGFYEGLVSGVTWLFKNFLWIKYIQASTNPCPNLFYVCIFFLRKERKQMAWIIFYSYFIWTWKYAHGHTIVSQQLKNVY